MTTLFKSPPKPKGPDPELIAAQKRQLEATERREKEAAAKEKENKKLVANLARPGGGVTLNPTTGERGVKTAKLGGAAA